MGDARDPPGFVQPPPPAHLVIPPAPVLSPEEALKSFRLQPGFRIELVASEPLIHDPVALDFDADGRIWVIEMQSYMPDVDGRGELDPISRVVVLEDTNGDGRMDTSTVYMEGLVLPRGIKVLEQGVLIAEPPNLWWTRDTNGDGKADFKVAIDTDFSFREANPEHGGSSFIWGMDNWIAAAMYPGPRYRIENGEWITSPGTLRGQWGLSQDDYGRHFTNTNSDYLRADLIPYHYPARSPHLQVVEERGGLGSGVFYRVDHDQELWPIRPTPGVNRGYQPNNLREDGTLRAFTAVCGLHVYRGDQFPAEYYGNVFAPEPAAHIIRRSIITEEDGILSGRNAYEGAEFLGSTDERFRPVNAYTAPDGTLYVVDMYRGILQHKQFVTSYLRRQIIERGLDKPTGLGRIYRIVHEGKPTGPQPRMSSEPSRVVAEHLMHPNGWWRDTAQRVLVERADRSIVPQLRAIALERSLSEPVRLHALWTLEGLGALEENTVLRVLREASPKLRVHGIRLSEPWLTEGGERMTGTIIRLAEDRSREVRLQVALSLGEASSSKRDAVLAQLAHRDAAEPFAIASILSSLAGRELPFLEQLASSPEWREQKPGLSNVLASLAAVIMRGGEPAAIRRAFELLALTDQPDWHRHAVLRGIEASGVRQLSEKPPGLDQLAQDGDERIAQGAANLAGFLIWPGKYASAPPLTAAEQRLFEQGRDDYRLLCAACHQENGRGLEGIAPPLVNSPWVLAPESIPIRILLKGKQGERLVMPPMEMLSNNQLAATLTYIRRSWGNEASPVSAGAVNAFRSALILRSMPFTDTELEALLQEELRQQQP